MLQAPIEAIEQRDRALQKIRDLTIACFLWATGLLAVFSVIAATTLPGHSQDSSNSFNGSSSSTNLLTDDGQLQAPAAGSFQAGGGSPLVVSGGSH